MWVCPRTRRKERWASIIPVAIHRFFMSPFSHFLTRPVTTRTVEIIDSMQFVFVNDRRNAPVIPSRATVNISSNPSRSDPAASGWSRFNCAASRRASRSPAAASALAKMVASRRSKALRRATGR